MALIKIKEKNGKAVNYAYPKLKNLEKCREAFLGFYEAKKDNFLKIIKIIGDEKEEYSPDEEMKRLSKIRTPSEIRSEENKDNPNFPKKIKCLKPFEYEVGGKKLRAKEGDKLQVSHQKAYEEKERGNAELYFISLKYDDKTIIETPLTKETHNENTDFKIQQFNKFYHFLLKNSPEGYQPWFFPCEKNGKNPSSKAIFKRDPESKGSWQHESARLNKEQCLEHLKEGYNLGISARDKDPLIIGDIDEPEYMNQLPEDTLTSTSRKRCGGHFFGWDKDGTAKINVPTDYGELRSSNQYVLSPGSYVPYNLENKKDKKAFDKLPEEAKKDELFGYYTVRNPQELKKIGFEDLPKFFIQTELENEQYEEEEKEGKEEDKKENKEFEKDGKYSDLFKLKVSDIVGKIPSNKRKGHPLHESDTDANFSLSKDGTLGFCWRHLVTLNAVQFLCVKNGYSKCQDAGTPFKNKSNPKRKRVSKIKGDKKALESAYKEAVEMGLIKENKNGTMTLAKSLDFLEDILNSKGELIGQKVKIDNVAEYIEDKFQIRTIFGLREETIEVYSEGYWTQKGRGLIKAEIERLLGSYARNNVVSEILEKVKRRTEIQREDLEEIPDFKRCLRNGTLDLENPDVIKLIPHSKDFNFRNRWDIMYNPSAKCPHFLKLNNEAFAEEDRIRFQEWVGFHLMKPYLFKKFAVFYGAKDTSKSVLLNWLNIFLSENVSGLSLHEISRGKAFDLLDLKNKDANICDDLSSADMAATGGIKMSVGDGSISAEQKFGDKIRFRNTAKHTFACNRIPSPKSDIDDEAYYDRILLFPLDNVVPKEKQDKDLIKKITTQEELSGALNWAIEGYKRLIKQNVFSYEKDPAETKYLMIKGGNSLAEFSSEVLIESAGDKISKDDMYSIYCKWCLEHKPKLSPDSKDKIGKNLIKFNPFIQSEKSGSERYWLNAKLRDRWDTFLKSIRDIWKSKKEGNKGSKNGGNNSSQNDLYNYLKPVPPAPKSDVLDINPKKKIKNAKKEKISQKNDSIKPTLEDLPEMSDKDLQEITKQIEKEEKNPLKLLDFIKQKDPESVNFEELKENFPEKDLEANLKQLQEQGIIYSPKENYWRYLG